jgi:hypothetical protein
MRGRRRPPAHEAPLRFAALAEKERAMISARTKAALAAARARGVRLATDEWDAMRH